MSILTIGGNQSNDIRLCAVNTGIKRFSRRSQKAIIYQLYRRRMKKFLSFKGYYFIFKLSTISEIKCQIIVVPTQKPEFGKKKNSNF